MPKEIMERKAADNEYLHKDFHGALSIGLDYLSERFGEQAVRDYLRQFALTFYAPLREKLKRKGLTALKEHFEKIYAIEGGQIEIDLSEEEMTLHIAACPAVMYMSEHGNTVSPYFVETTRTVSEAICESSDYCFELAEYDAKTGRSVQRFFLRMFDGRSPQNDH